MSHKEGETFLIFPAAKAEVLIRATTLARPVANSQRSILELIDSEYLTCIIESLDYERNKAPVCIRIPYSIKRDCDCGRILVLENVRDCDCPCVEVDSAFILAKCLVSLSATSNYWLFEKNLVSPLKSQDSIFADWVNRGESDGV